MHRNRGSSLRELNLKSFAYVNSRLQIIASSTSLDFCHHLYCSIGNATNNLWMHGHSLVNNLPTVIVMLLHNKSMCTFHTGRNNLVFLNKTRRAIVTWQRMCRFKLFMASNFQGRAWSRIRLVLFNNTVNHFQGALKEVIYYLVYKWIFWACRAVVVRSWVTRRRQATYKYVISHSSPPH